jgi:MFS family permease
VINKVSKINKTSPFNGVLQGEQTAGKETDTKPAPAAKQYSYIDIFRYASIRGNVLIQCFNYFSTALCYYLVTFSLGDYEGNEVVNGLVMGTGEFLAVFPAMYMLEKTGRKTSFMASWVISFVASVCAILFHALANYGCEECVVVETVSLGFLKFGLTANFVVLTIYMAELFPTVVRGLVFGASSLCGRVSTITSPVIINFSEKSDTNPILCTVALLLLSTLLSTRLPETRNKEMKEHLDEELESSEKFKEAPNVEMQGREVVGEQPKR